MVVNLLKWSSNTGVKRKANGINEDLLLLTRLPSQVDYSLHAAAHTSLGGYAHDKIHD
jgi:hypothetical protein